MLCGILFVLYTGIRWEFLPQEFGFGSRMTCWRRLRDWNDAGVWTRAAREPAGRAARGGRAGLVAGGDRRLTPSGHEGRPETGPSPVDRARTGSKRHLITEAHGIPLQASLTGGSRNDVTQLMPLIQDIPPVRGRRGRPRRRPGTVYADRVYDHDKYRKQVRAVGVLLLWPGSRNPTATHFRSAGGSRCGTHPWRRHRQRGIR